MKTLTRDEFTKQYGQESVTRFKPIQPSQDYFQRVTSDIKTDAPERADRVNAIINRPNVSLPEKVTQVFGTSAGGAANLIESAITEIPGVKPALEKVGEGFNWLSTSKYSPIKYIGDAVGQSKALQEATSLYDTDQNFKDTIDSVANLARLGLDVTGVVDSAGFVKNVTSKIVKDTTSLIKPISEQAIEKLKISTENTPASIMNRVARVTPKEATTFENLAGKPIGDYLVETGNFGSPEKIIQTEALKFTKSKNLVDTELDKLPGVFKPAPVKDMLEALSQRAVSESSSNVKAPYTQQVSELLNKFNKDGLDMTEINIIKRLFERNVKLGYNKFLNSEKVAQATNVDNAVRNWQFSQAKKLGFENIDVLNKQTQIAKFIVDKLGDSVIGKSGLNAVNLTDWLILAGGNPESIAGFLTKKFFSSKSVQAKIAEIINQKDVKPFIQAQTSITPENIKRQVSPGGFEALPEGVTKTPKVELPITVGPKGFIEPQAGQVFRTTINPKTGDLFVKDLKSGKTKIIPKNNQLEYQANTATQIKNANNPIKSNDITESGLFQEAKKYKNAEEFVKAQGTPVYHGTNVANIIEKEGFKKMPIRTGMSAFGDGSYFTNKIGNAKGYGDVVKAFLKKDIKLKKVFDSDAYKVDTQKLIKEGYDGTIMDTGNGNNIVIFDNANIKTKSQLIDIWEKANKKQP